MKKNKKFILAGIGLICTVGVLVAFTNQKHPQADTQKENPKVNMAAKKTSYTKLKTVTFDFKKEDTRAEKADGWSNGQMFNNTWRKKNIVFKDGIMQLIIDSDGENANPKYSGGEYRTKEMFHYGLYEVRMKPIKNDGVVSSFFTYTGPSDNNPWDEIDIEFLGKDPSKVQFNYYTNGKGNHEMIHDLGFDASTSFHTYSFEWLPNSITWFVDGKKVHQATQSIPTTPGKIMLNAWPGIGVDSWLKAFDGKIPLTAEYQWFKVTPYKMNGSGTNF